MNKQEAALAAYHKSYPARSRAVHRETVRMIAKMRKNPPRQVPHQPINESEDYEDRWGNTMRDQMLSPGT